MFSNCDKNKTNTTPPKKFHSQKDGLNFLKLPIIYTTYLF